MKDKEEIERWMREKQVLEYKSDAYIKRTREIVQSKGEVYICFIDLEKAQDRC